MSLATEQRTSSQRAASTLTGVVSAVHTLETRVTYLLEHRVFQIPYDFFPCIS